MQVRQIFIFTISLIFLFLPKESISQKVTVNEEGEQIVVYPDGSWHFYEEGELEDSSKTEGKSKVRKKKKNKRKKNSKKKAADIDPAFEESERYKAIQRAERAAAMEETARLKEEETIFKRLFIEDQLDDAYHNIDMTHEDIAAMEVRLKAASSDEATAKSNYKEAQERSKTYEKMIDMTASKRNRLLAKMGEDIFEPTEKDEPGFDDITDIAFEQNENVQQESYMSASVVNRPPVRRYNPKSNVLRFPPTRPCDLAFSGLDEFSGKKRKQTKETFFFAHTPERFRSYFKGRDYIVCTGTLIAIDGTPRSISIEYTIATDQAAREFGTLAKGSQLILRLLDGDRLILVNNKTATGIADSVTKTTRYNINYPLNKSQIKTLEEAEVDKVRMIWATGYEDYEVYQVDFFRDLFRCLEEG
ncbi:MAG: hypothetical protein AB8F74_05960 [Saprospiraceae bacterium]